MKYRTKENLKHVGMKLTMFGVFVLGILAIFSVPEVETLIAVLGWAWICSSLDDKLES